MTHGCGTLDALEALASRIYQLYESLPPNGKPRVRDNSRAEWTVLAAVALVKADREPLVVSLATGVRCLPRNKLSPHGDTIHDSHAEVLARRGFVVWLLEQAALLRADASADPWIERSPSNQERFRLRTDVDVCFYVSTLPCGDASLILLDHSHPEPADANAMFRDSWLLSVSSALLPPSGEHSGIDTATPNDTSSMQLLRGHLGFSHNGALRTKPGRLDSPPSTSLSCSDKFALCSILGLQGSLASHIFEAVYLSTYMFALPDDAVSAGLDRNVVEAEVRRALVGRVEHYVPASRAPHIALIDTPFRFSREVVGRTAKESDLVTSVICLSYVSGLGVEVIGSNGQKQGSSARRNQKGPLPPKARSRLCKLEVLARYQRAASPNADPTSSYFALKHPSPRDSDSMPRSITEYRSRKDELRRKDGPFKRWIVHGRPFESFNADGELVDATQ